MSIALRYISSMFYFRIANTGRDAPWMYFWEMKFELLACVLLSFISVPRNIKCNKWVQKIWNTILLLLFYISVSYLVKGSYSPFLYFNF